MAKTMTMPFLCGPPQLSWTGRRSLPPLLFFCQHSQAPHTGASFAATSENKKGHQAHLPSLQVWLRQEPPMTARGPDTTPQKCLCSWEGEASVERVCEKEAPWGLHHKHTDPDKAQI